MKKHIAKRKSSAVAKSKADQTTVTANVQADCSLQESLQAEAMKEPKRFMLMDFIATIKTLRDEKKFSFRAIADWLGQRGIETDHSAVYRIYLAAIPEENRDPEGDWSDIDASGVTDENVKFKKP